VQRGEIDAATFKQLKKELAGEALSLVSVVSPA